MQVPFTDGKVVSVIGDSPISTARNQGIQDLLSIQLQRGCAQSPAIATDRIDDPTSIVQGVVLLGGEGAISNRHHGFQREYAAFPVLFSSSGQKSTRTQCVDSGLVSPEGHLPFSTTMADSTDNAKTQIIQRTGHHDCTMDSGRTLVPRDPGQSNQVEVAPQLRDSKYWTAELRRLDHLQFLKQALSHVHGETIADSLVLA